MDDKKKNVAINNYFVKQPEGGGAGAAADEGDAPAVEAPAAAASVAEAEASDSSSCDGEAQSGVATAAGTSPTGSTGSPSQVHIRLPIQAGVKRKVALANLRAQIVVLRKSQSRLQIALAVVSTLAIILLVGVVGFALDKAGVINFF
eukprot:scpid104733/ scgid13777/ 